MGFRLGAGFRLGRHVWIGASIPLGHARRLGRHQGHGDWFDTASQAGDYVGFLAGVLGAGVGIGGERSAG
jgi:hypothetical protein